jgi:hypothetical protein
MDDDAKRAIALFRLGVLGPLVSARLEHGDRTAYFVEAASRRHVMPPDGRIVRLSARTIEAWYSAGLAVMRSDPECLAETA